MGKYNPDTRYFPATLTLGHKKVGGARAEGDDEAVVKPDAKGRIPVALSSEFGVERYDWMTGESYKEVLSHTPEAVNLERAALARGLPLLLNHDRWSPDAFVGKVEDITVDDDRVMRGYLVFSKSARAQEVMQDVLDDLRGSVSIGYQVSENFESKEDKKSGEITRVFSDWIPLELSLVPVPADPTVGVGRSADGMAQIPLKELDALRAKANAAPAAVAPAATAVPSQTREESMNEPTPAAAATPAAPEPASAAPDIKVVREAMKQETSDRVRQYGELAQLSGVPLETVNKWITNETPTSEAAREAREFKAKKDAEPVKPASAGLSEKEARRFSYAKSMILQLQGTPKYSDPEIRGIDCGFEREVMADFVSRNPHLAGKGSGNILPSMLMAQTADRMSTRTGLDSGTSNKGTELKFNQPGDFIELLRAHLLLYKAGATLIPGLTGPLVMPRQTASGTLSWIADNPGSDTSITEMSMDTVTLAIKTAISVSAYTRQLLITAAGNYAVEDLIRQDLAETFAEGIDSVALNGGGSNQPSGILQHTGIGSVTIGADGGALTYAKVVDLETAVANAKGDRGNLAYFSNPTVRGAAKKLLDVNSTYGTSPLWGALQFPDGSLTGKLNGYPAFASTGVPSNLTKGTATTICSALIFGDAAQVMIGEFGGFDVFVDPFTLAAQGKIRVVGTQFVDVGIRQYQRFAAIKDIR